MRRRLDAELVRRELAPSRARAQELIAAGLVTVAGAPAHNADRLVAPGEAVVVHGGGPRFVSRAGEKLDAALDRFGIDVAGARVLDVGASTGGFTDCVLGRGARRVVAVDVGRGQLHWRMRSDERVVSLERTDARDLDGARIGAPFDLVVVDVSFISLRLVLRAIVDFVAPEGDLVALVKPQFEAGRGDVGRGGIVRDAAVHRRVVVDVVAECDALAIAAIDVMASPIRGAEGNVEFLLHARRGGTRLGADSIDAAVANAHREAS